MFPTDSDTLTGDSEYGSLFKIALDEALRQIDAIGALEHATCSREEVFRHLDHRQSDDVLSLAQDELEDWEAAQWEYRIGKIEWEDKDEVEQQQLIVEAALDQLVGSIVERALLPSARRFLNRCAKHSSGNSLTNVAASGLHQLLPRDFELQTAAARDVSRIIRQQRTAAIGIAGARGSGKTTLIEWFTRNQVKPAIGIDFFVPRGRHIPMQRRVFVSAPVQYDTRDFLLYVFEEVCYAVSGGPRNQSPLTASSYSKPREVAVGITNTALGLLLRALHLISGISAAYLTFLLLAKFVALPLSVEVVRQVLALLALSWVSFGLSLVAATTARNGGQTFFVMLAHLKRPDYPLILLSCSAILGAIAIPFYALRYHYSLDDSTLLLGAGVVTTLLVTASLWRALKWQLMHRPGHLDRWSAATAFERSKTDLQKRADAYINEIRFQQTFTSGWGGKIAATSQVLSGEISNTEGVSLARSSWTLPETVQNLKALLAEAANVTGSFIIGIDEVDKIEEIAAARRFVDDIKAIFHVPGCFYLVSVSDDAVASFETRGLPFRDAFDSAFDEVIRVDYGNLAASQDVLNGRVVGLPTVFVAMCHVLSGGLPRDLLRVTRFTLSLGATSFGEVYESVVRRELLSKMPALVRNLVNLNAPTIFSIVSWAEQAALPWKSDTELHVRLKNLREAILALGRDESMSPQERATALRSASEAEVVFLLGCTIIEYCRAIDAPSITTDKCESLASLAFARQEIAVHPAVAALRIKRFRERESLPEL